MTPPYYADHEGVYRRLAAAGHVCWDRTAFDQFTLRPFLERALTALGPPRSVDGARARALDVGCGTGPVAALLVDRGYDALGIDVSETAIRLARERFGDVAGPRPSFAVQDALDLGADEDGRYDLVVDAHCFHCVVFDDERRRFLSALRRALAPGGALVVETMADHDDVFFDALMATPSADGQRAFAFVKDGEVLWRVVADDERDAADVRVKDGRRLQPQRRLRAPEALRRELESAGFAIDLEAVQRQEDAREPWSYQAIARRR